MFKPIHAVLFDLDGTLIDSAPDLGAAANQMRAARGMSLLPLQDYRSQAGAGARGMLRVAFDLGPEHPNYETLREEFFSNYQACMTQRTTVFAGVSELIGALEQRGFPWGVVTNKLERFCLPLTQKMALFNGAATIISGDTTPHSKPHPAPLLEAAKRLQVQPGACVYVGDDTRDIRAGHAAGMHTVAARYGYLESPDQVKHWGAHACIDSPLELLDLVIAPQ